MPQSKYIKLAIGGNQADTGQEDLPVAISYKLEDVEDFQKKTGTEAFGITLPASVTNDAISNTFHNPSVDDATPDEVYRNFRPAVIEVGGNELLVGKAILKSAKHTDVPTSYNYDLYAGNADWKIDLQEKTFYDALSHISYQFTKAAIVATWAFDGTNENMPYVFAPVKYRAPMGGYDANNNPIDDNVAISYLRPSLSKYWIIYWALKSVGYRIQSSFLDSSYFRRQVMPWTWGNYLTSEGTRLTVHNFLANSNQDYFYQVGQGQGMNQYVDLGVGVDPARGGFDNNGDYSYGTWFEMVWEYKTNQNFGILDAHLSMRLQYNLAISGDNSDSRLQVEWYHLDSSTGIASLQRTDVIYNESPGWLGTTIYKTDIPELFFNHIVNPGDKIFAKVYLRIYRQVGFLNVAHVTLNVLEYKLDYFRIPLGGTIDFQNYTGFKNYKVLDLLRGVIDEFNLAIQTDNINKVVLIEPTHPYSLVHDQATKSGGYFNGNFLDWQQKQDLNTEAEIQNYADSERELVFKYRNDTSDGILKLIQDRNITTLASGKYVLPSRFKTGRKEVENRFFAPTMHYEAEQWKTITGLAPQLICLIPENVSNTSQSESENTFIPKSVFYKGLVAGVGGWKFDGDNYTSIPFMFAVNYKDGGHNDPILSYSDEKIKDGIGSIVGVGLLRRFYLQRMAIMREGKFYTPAFRLNNTDVMNWFHREHIICRGNKWELIELNDYKPTKDESTVCFLKKWTPISEADRNNSFPSATTIVNGTTPGSSSFDVKYWQLKCLISDIPK